MPLEEMLAPLSAGSPAGENTEYDPRSMELESLAAGSPEEGMLGDDPDQRRDPEWRKLRRSCEALWGVTRDLRVAAYWTVAETMLEGIEGLRSGLKLIDHLVTDLWNDFWPRLDPDDDNDPTERINILQMLSPEQGVFGDRVLFISKFRELRLVPDLRYSLRDLMILNGMLEAADGTRPDGALMDAEMTAVPVSVMTEKLAAAQESLALLADIAEKMNAAMGDTGYITFASLEHELKILERFYSLHAQSSASEEEAAAAPEAAAGKAPAAPAAAAAPAIRPAGFTIADYHPANRAEALLLLKKSAEYFQNAEPTSPVPFLISRALRMAEMNFIELLGEIDQNAQDRGREQLGVPRPQDSY